MNSLIFGVVIVVLIILIYYVWSAWKSRPKYSCVERSKRLTQLRNKKSKSLNDHFEHASLIDTELSENATNRDEKMKEAIDEYRETLEKLDDEQPDAMFIVDRIDNFRVAQLEDNDYEDWVVNMMFNLNRDLNLTTEKVVQKSIDHRIEDALAKSDVKAEIAADILEQSKITTSDAQNVHDYTVNKNMRTTIYVLRLTVPNYDRDASYAEMDVWLANMPKSEKLDKAIRIFMGIKSDNLITTFNSNELEIVTLVWERNKDPLNLASQELMRDSLFEALVDCFDDNGMIVCLNGRCTRYLQSLVILDFNPIIGKAMTNEAYKNQIYDETKHLIDIQIEQWASDSDPKKISVAQNYKGVAVKVDPEYEQAFVTEVKYRIDENLKNYEGILIESEIDRLRLDCYASVDF